MNTIALNLQDINEEIKKCCDKVKRDPAEVKLIAVSKFKPVEVIEDAYKLGHRNFGENRVQELVDKVPALPHDIKWHLIGTLQRNKVKYIVDSVELIHSVHSLALAREISKQAKKKNVDVNILLQVNIAEEESKHGFQEDQLLSELKEIASLEGIKVKGLMTMAPIADDPEKVRPVFRGLRLLAEKIKEFNYPNVDMKELSMGMSDDFKVAIEEGATYVRIGSRIFGPRN